MQHRFLRFLPPIFFAGLGLALAMFIVDWTMESMIPLLPVGPIPSLTVHIDGDMRVDVLWLLTYIVPILIAEYVFLVLPVASLFLLFNKLLRVRKYDVNIMKLGKEFGAIPMIRRAVVPALFSLAIGQLVFQLMQGWLFNIPPPEDISQVALPYYLPLISIISALIVLPVSLLYFMPTWVLNDAGIVTHLKNEELRLRRCPDTIGVGRWYSNFLGGFSLVAVPITSIILYFVTPIQHLLLINPTPSTEILLPIITRGIFYSVGMPVLAMAFIIPIVIFHEMLGSLMKRPIRRIAERLGANKVELETIE